VAKQVKWAELLEQAADIVSSSGSMTLRQLFYRLVSVGSLPNTHNYYVSLSRYTAEARRSGGFPSLVDRTRSMLRRGYEDNPDDAVESMASGYARDRSEGQEWEIYLGVEKDALSQLLWNWFSQYGFTIIPLSGYSSQTFVDDIQSDAFGAGRPAVLLYSGDFDPSGEDIERDLEERTNGCFKELRRIALTREQVTAYNLPPFPGKASDSRAGRFVAKYGELIQVELDALPPETFRELFKDAIGEYWDEDTYNDVIRREEAEAAMLQQFVEAWSSWDAEDE